MTDVVEKLHEGIVEHPRRWSGDTHADKGGSADYEATRALMNEAAYEIECLRDIALRNQKEADALRADLSRTREALAQLLDGCWALDREEAILPRQMYLARNTLKGTTAEEIHAREVEARSALSPREEK